MTSSLENTIQLFYHQTNTPHNARPDDPRIDLIIESLQLIKNKSRNFQQATNSDIHSTVYFILRLVDIPENLQGLLALEPCILYLVKHTANLLTIAPVEDKDAILAIIAKFYAIVKTSSKPEDLIMYNDKPLNENSLLSRFHYDAYDFSLLTDQSCPLYFAYGYLLHKRIRHNGQCGLEEKTVEDYIRSARYFFKYMPIEIKSKKVHPTIIPFEYVSAFIAEYNRRETSSPTPLNKNATKYKKTFNRLLDRWDGKPSPRLGYIPYDELDPVDGDITILDKDEGEYQNIAIIRDEDDPQVQEEPFNESEFGYIKKNSNEDIVDKKPKLSRKWSDLVNLRSFHYPWDAKHLNLFHYAVLYQALCSNYEKDEKSALIVLYLLLLIHTGINHRLLLLLTVNDLLDPEDYLLLKKINGRYYILNTSFIFRKEKMQNNHCYQSSSIIYIPIPDEIMALFRDRIRNGLVFNYINKNGILTQLTTDHIKAFLGKEVSNEADYKKYNLRITPSKITSSFLTLYNMRGGLDELVSTYISGHDYHRLYGAQAHYIHIPHANLEKEYLSSFHTVNKLIIDNYRESIKLRFFGDYKNGDPDFIKKLSNIEKPSNIIVNKSLDGYGSAIIVKDDYIYKLINALKDKIQRSQNPIQKHNYYTCYAYLALQFGTGMRPRNNPNLTWENFNSDLEIFTIRDKESVKFHEVRTVPLTNSLALLLCKMRGGFVRLQHFIALHHYPSIFTKEQSNIFFFVSGNGHFIDFDLDNMSTLLQSVIPDYNLPSNMPRHYLRNFLYHSGISNDVSDAIFGHQHNGKELLNVISSTSASDVRKFALPTINKMLRQLGIEEVNYV